jgi:uncharacterized protein YbgA (DUF1722 family)/uncharacterized protein YbbK (DUF523 family)
MTLSPVSADRITIGISTCLLGEKVRFDAGHKHDRYITDILGAYFEFIPVCPELEVGMGVPRESIRLLGTADNPRLVGLKSGTDWTEKMNAYSHARVKQLESYNLSGYIFKADSPSCGMERVRVHSDRGMPTRNGRGLYTEVFMKHFPLVPVEEEGRLHDARLRENFIERIFGYHRLQTLVSTGFRRKDLIDFHTRHKYLLLSHSPKHYEILGRFVAKQRDLSTAELERQYSSLFMEALKIKTTAKKNVNVLKHILGFLREFITADERKDILQIIDDYHRELIPLIVPITVIAHYTRKHKIPYIQEQIYLNPHPKELMLRNHV